MGSSTNTETDLHGALSWDSTTVGDRLSPWAPTDTFHCSPTGDRRRLRLGGDRGNCTCASPCGGDVAPIRMANLNNTCYVYIYNWTFKLKRHCMGNGVLNSLQLFAKWFWISESSESEVARFHIFCASK